MQTGDTLTDSHGTPWVVDAALGRDAWSHRWALRGDGGSTALLRVPLTAADFPEADDPGALARDARAVAEAQRHAMQTRRWPFLPELLGTVDVDGAEALVVPRHDDLESRLAGGMAFSEALDVAVRILHVLTHTTHQPVVHGNLRPQHVAFDDAGRVRLTDPALPDVAERLIGLQRHAPARPGYHPPEAGVRPAAGWDTWAICLMLYRAAMASSSRDGGRATERVDLPAQGLSRLDLTTVKDAAAARLRAESANKRFASRATERFGAILNRGLSPEAEPSPPYRFRTASELQARLVEVDELIHPSVSSVSQLLLGPEASEDVFEGGAPVVFSVNVGTSSGVTAESDLATGLQLRDVDAPGDGRIRVRDSRFTVKRYPSGRWRYRFELPDLPPGRYEVKVAFMVKGSSEPPQVAEGAFEVRPRPGYVPPPASPDEPPAPIPLRQRDPSPEPAAGREPAPEVITFPGLHEPSPSGPPRPVRPSGSPMARDAEDLPPTVPNEGTYPPSTAPSAGSRPTPPPAAVPSPGGSPFDAAAHTSPTEGSSVPRAPGPPAPAPLPPAQGVPSEVTPEPLPQVEPGAHDPMLYDYPSPGADSGELPRYDDAGRPPAPWWEDARDRLVERLGGDPFTAVIAVSAALFIGAVLVIFLARSL